MTTLITAAKETACLTNCVINTRICTGNRLQMDVLTRCELALLFGRLEEKACCLVFVCTWQRRCVFWVQSVRNHHIGLGDILSLICEDHSSTLSRG